jgi:5-(carboxyamino)imidazole ribonucleotide synthase
MMIGVLGGGQLARMLALAGIPLGLQFRFLDTSPYAPAAAVGDLIVGDFEDHDVVERFVRSVDAATYEFENIPARTVESIEARVPVFPSSRALRIGQDRLLEKQFFGEQGVSVHEFAPVSSLPEFHAALEAVGLPAVVKTRRMGYDGKGQAVIRRRDEIDAVWANLGSSCLLVEKFVPFVRELSVLAVRNWAGDLRLYDWVENVHHTGILRLSRAPARVDPAVAEPALNGIRRALIALAYVGVLAVEFFDVGDRLLFNEMAPRVHNSGHWTIEGARTSQFENHCRAVAGLPLGDCRADAPAAMVNLIGSIPPVHQMLEVPGARVHLYGKEPRPARKVGHVTLVHRPGDSMHDFEAHIARLRNLAGT